MDQKQRILKAVVIILGILLLISFGVVAVTIVSRLSKMGKDEAAGTQSIEDVVLTSEFGEAAINIPAGGRIGSISADGKTLFVVIDHADGQGILVVDPWSGRERGRIKLVPEAE